MAIVLLLRFRIVIFFSFLIRQNAQHSKKVVAFA